VGHALAHSVAKLRSLALIGAVIFAFATNPALSQVSTFRASIPFPFIVGNQTLPAATYVVQRFLGKLKTGNDMGVIVMKATGPHVYKVIVTAPGGDRHAAHPQGSELIFTSFKGKQYLNRIWVAGDAVAHQLPNVSDEIPVPGTTGEVIVTALNYSRSK
jgi:hypothetical protein